MGSTQTEQAKRLKEMVNSEVDLGMGMCSAWGWHWLLCGMGIPRICYATAGLSRAWLCQGNATKYDLQSKTQLVMNLISLNVSSHIKM